MSIAEKQIKVKKENKKLKTKQKKSKKPPKNKTKQKKPTKIKREMKLIVPALSPILLWIEYYSIMWLIGRRLFNNFSLLELVNSFSSSLIFLIVFFKLSKYSCFVFLACKYRMKISNRWFISIACWLLSNIPTMKLCGVKGGLFINCERYCLSLFHNCLVFKQEWNRWNGISSSSLQYEERG